MIPSHQLTNLENRFRFVHKDSLIFIEKIYTVKHDAGFLVQFKHVAGPQLESRTVFVQCENSDFCMFGYKLMKELAERPQTAQESFLNGKIAPVYQPYIQPYLYQGQQQGQQLGGFGCAQQGIGYYGQGGLVGNDSNTGTITFTGGSGGLLAAGTSGGEGSSGAV